MLCGRESLLFGEKKGRKSSWVGLAQGGGRTGPMAGEAQNDWPFSVDRRGGGSPRPIIPLSFRHI
jgi:hypothetical protein